MLQWNRGNNALQYEQRLAFGSQGQLRVPALRSGDPSDLAITSNTTFEVAEHEKLRSFSWLQELIEYQLAPSKRIYFIDNHNHAFYCWRKACKDWLFVDADLVHIDQHSDLNEPSRYPESSDLESLENVAIYTNEVLQVGSFIKPALQCGLIASQQQFRTEWSVLALDPAERHRDVILDLDLDFRAPGMLNEHVDATITKVKSCISHPSVKVVTIATSPYFLDQEKALELVRSIVS